MAVWTPCPHTLWVSFAVPMISQEWGQDVSVPLLGVNCSGIRYILRENSTSWGCSS